MKGVFGILLVGGGVILLVGLFTGKINFPAGGTPHWTSTPATSGGATGPIGVPPGQPIQTGNGVVFPGSTGLRGFN